MHIFRQTVEIDVVVIRGVSHVCRNAEFVGASVEDFVHRLFGNFSDGRGEGAVIVAKHRFDFPEDERVAIFSQRSETARFDGETGVGNHFLAVHDADIS